MLVDTDEMYVHLRRSGKVSACESAHITAQPHKNDPMQAQCTGTVVLLHGFSRSPERLADIATMCRSLGAEVVAPHLSAWWWPTSTNNTRHLSRLAHIVAEDASGPIVVVGHSAGGAAGAWMAAAMERAGAELGSLVLVDPVESPVRSIRRSWSALERVPVTAIIGAPSPCNRQGAFSRWLAEQRHVRFPSLEVVNLPTMGHGDIEGAGIGVYVRLCGDDPAAPARSELLAIVRQAVERGLGADAK